MKENFQFLIFYSITVLQDYALFVSQIFYLVVGRSMITLLVFNNLVSWCVYTSVSLSNNSIEKFFTLNHLLHLNSCNRRWLDCHW